MVTPTNHGEQIKITLQKMAGFVRWEGTAMKFKIETHKMPRPTGVFHCEAETPMEVMAQINHWLINGNNANHHD